MGNPNLSNQSISLKLPFCSNATKVKYKSPKINLFLSFLIFVCELVVLFLLLSWNQGGSAYSVTALKKCVLSRYVKKCFSKKLDPKLNASKNSWHIVFLTEIFQYTRILGEWAIFQNRWPIISVHKKVKTMDCILWMLVLVHVSNFLHDNIFKNFPL